MSLNIFIMIFGSMLGIGTGVFITLSKIVANFKRYGKAPFLYMMGMSLLTGAGLFLISYVTENYFNIYIPVSYTHLDVYKRQS